MQMPDVNILVYAHREGTPQHARYRDWLIRLATGPEPFALSEPALQGFVRVVTNGRIASVLVANKDGLTTIQPNVVIDCTGDGDVAAWSGAPFEQNAEVQPLTLHFRIGHVKKSPDLAKNCRVALEKAQQRGELPLYYGPGVSFLYGDDEVYIHGVRVPADPTNAADLSRAEIQGRSDAYATFFDG